MKRWATGLCAAFLCCALALPAAARTESYDLDASRIRAATEELSIGIGIRETGTPAERAACDWIEAQLFQQGYAYEDGSLRREGFQGFKERTSENLIARVNPGASALVTVVAHYDSYPTTPGARDNAAAVGILLEIARYLRQEPRAFSCEIRLLFAGSEENGYHGSRSYVKSLSLQERSRHIAAFNMDISATAPQENAHLVLNMLGGKDARGQYADGVSLCVMENAVTRAATSAAQVLYGLTPQVFYYGESDQVSFHNAELEAANICWRRTVDGFPKPSAEYHQMTDTPEGIDYESARTVGRCVLKAIELLDGDGGDG